MRRIGFLFVNGMVQPFNLKPKIAHKLLMDYYRGEKILEVRCDDQVWHIQASNVVLITDEEADDD